MVLVVHELPRRQGSYKKIVGNLVLFLTPVVFTMVLWFGWNALIFGNPLYSFIGPYSAHAQQSSIQAHSSLITKDNIFESLKAFGFDSLDIVGIVAVLAGGIGWFIYLLKSRVSSLDFRILVAILLGADIVFNIIALFAGFSILNVPELQWNPYHQLSGTWFNVRYGIMALPFFAIGFGLLAARLKRYSPVLVVVVLQLLLLLHGGLITVKDGTIGSSSFADQDIAKVLKKDVQPDENVLMSTSTFNAVMFQSGLNLSQFIHEGLSREWNDAISHPSKYAQWIVMPNGDRGDSIYASLITQEKSAFLGSYKLIYMGKHANIYEKKTAGETFVTANSSQLQINGKKFTLHGVNDYDLASRSKSDIDKTFQDLQSAHVNAVRFWLFGDGTSDGFQPTAGARNEQAFARADHVLAEAHKYHIRLIPTLVNNWPDYGGVDQYLRWVGQDPADHNAFYTNTAVRKLYENYINYVLSRRNTITNTSYANDPSILAWDIMNEPRADGDNTKLIATWADVISSYVHKLDANHLVTIGLDQQTENTGLADICQKPHINFCSVHMYLEFNQVPYYDNYAQETKQLSYYKRVARTTHKPLLMSEIGIPKDYRPYGKNPLTTLKASTQQLDKDGYAGWLVWNWSLKPDDSYGFSPSGSRGQYSLKDLRSLQD